MTTAALEDLTEAERFLVLSVARGEPVDMKRNTVRGSVVRDLALESRAGWVLPPAGLRLQRVIIDGGLDLEGCSLAKPFLIWHSRIQGGGDRGALLIRDARLKRLGIHSSTVEGAIVADRAEIENGFFLGGGLVRGAIQVRGAEIGGALGIEGTELGDGKAGLLAAGLRLTGPLILRRARIKGEVAFPRSVLAAGIYGEEAVVVREGVAVNGESARIEGDVLLDRANISGTVRLVNARVGGQISAEGLVVAATPSAVLAAGINVGQGVNLSEARIAGTLSLEGAVIGKMFRAEGMEVWGSETAVGADVIRVGGNWDMGRAKLVGHLSLPGAEINGQLRLTEARLLGSGLAIRADGARIRGGCFLSRTTVVGLLRFPAAEIGNQFRLRGATLTVDAGAALLASATQFKRDVELGDGFAATGALVFDQAVIGGMCDLTGSRIMSVALAGTSMAEPAPARTREGSEAWWDETALSLVDAKIDRLAMPSKPEERPRGIVDLSRAQVGSYLDYAAAWPPVVGLRGRSRDNRDIDHLVLDGFTYEHLSNPAGADRQQPGGGDQAGALRVRWLEGQAEDDLRGHFKPQAWVELAQRLAQQGHHDDARAILIARRRRELKSASTTRGQRWQGRILDLFALYGYNPWRTVLWMALVVVLFGGIWSLAAQSCLKAGCLDETVFVVANRDAYTAERFADTYPPFNALGYSFDVFVPFVPFGYEDHWRPNIAWQPFATLELPSVAATTLESIIPAAATGESPFSLTLTLGGVLYFLVIVETLFGLVLTSLAVTGFTGLLRSDA